MPHPITQFFTVRIPFLPPNQQRQSTEGKKQTIYTAPISKIESKVHYAPELHRALYHEEWEAELAYMSYYCAAHTSRTALRSPWYFITCMAQSSRLSSRGTQTRSCFSRPTRNSWASSRRGDGPRSRSIAASRLFCSHTIDLPHTAAPSAAVLLKSSHKSSTTTSTTFPFSSKSDSGVNSLPDNDPKQDSFSHISAIVQVHPN